MDIKRTARKRMFVRLVMVFMLLVCSTVVVLFVVQNSTTRAEAEGLWESSGDSVYKSLGSVNDYTGNHHCTDQRINVDGLPSFLDSYRISANEITGCVYNPSSSATGMRYAVYSRPYAQYGSYGEDKSLVMGFGFDKKMYRVNLPTQPLPEYVPNFDGLVYRDGATGGIYVGSRLAIFKDVHTKLLKVSSDSYNFDYSSPDFVFKRPNGRIITVGSVAASANGRWLVFEAVNLGIVRLDLKTFEMKRISTFNSSYYINLGTLPTMHLAVSDDGESVAMSGRYIPFQVIRVIDSCGDMATVTDAIDNNTPMAHPCYERDLGNDVYSNAGVYQTIEDLGVSSDGGQIEFTVTKYNGGAPLRASLSAPGYTAPTLEYLALGDSYSSGEGDIGKRPDGMSYYLPLTYTYPDNCHVSSRSYPFLLRDHFAIPESSMKSVACSGARIVFDYDRPSNGYLGQSNRLAKINDVESSQQAALDKFIPGRVPQIEFIKKYRPNAVTLTGGGNDAGFADILAYCAQPAWEGLFVDDTCAYAKPGSQLSNLLSVTIRDQYRYAKHLVESIKTASPNTKVYIIGYPSFIAGSNGVCALNSGVLGGRERDMVNQATSYLNANLKKAADSSGATYIDIEDSLDGGRLCEGSKFVTGLWDVGILNERERKQTFHPNSMGHQQIAQSIIANSSFSLSSSPMIPTSEDTGWLDIPASFGSANLDNFHAQNTTMTVLSLVRSDKTASISLPPYSFAPDTSVSVSIYSDLTPLGDYSASNTGELSVPLDIPSTLPLGKHLLVVSGKSYTDEPISYYQFIDLNSEDTNDSDGDGVPNQLNHCNFIEHWYDENSGKDTCVTEASSTTSQSLPTTYRDDPWDGSASTTELIGTNYEQYGATAVLGTSQSMSGDLVVNGPNKVKKINGLSNGAGNTQWLFLVGPAVLIAAIITTIVIIKRRINK